MRLDFLSFVWPLDDCVCKHSHHELAGEFAMVEVRLDVCWRCEYGIVNPYGELGLCVTCKIELQHTEDRPEDQSSVLAAGV